MSLLAGTNLGGLGTGLNILGTVASSISQFNTARFNADIQSQNISLARQKGDDETTRRKRKLARQIGTQTALLAKAGVDISSGSPLLAFEETIKIAEEDFAAINLNRNAAVLKAQLKQENARFTGRQALRVGALSVGNTLLTRRAKRNTVSISG